jgi:hypothetical protein
MTASSQLGSGRSPASRIGSTMFSRAVSTGSRLNAWKTKPIRRRRSAVSSSSRMPVSSVPPSHTCPLVAASSPARQCMRVDLPEPDGPMMAVNSPRAKATSTPARAWTAVSPLP